MPRWPGDLTVGRQPAKRLGQLVVGVIQVSGPPRGVPRKLLEAPDRVDDRALDPPDRVGLELDSHARIVPVHRLDQADRAVADDVLRAEHARAC